MKHCVASYDWECEVGISQIYSICDCSTGAHIATVHIRQGNRKREWQLTQVNGPGNQPVSLLIQDIASSITSLYNLNEC